MEEHQTPTWTCSEVLQLIQEYGKRPALWDPDSEDYKNRFRKHHKWMELAAIFKCSKLEVERKMKTLNSQYRRERLKALRMRKMGKEHRVSWYGYNSFAFMNKHWVRYKNRVTLMTSPEEEMKQEVHVDSNEFESGADLMPFFEEEESEQQQNEVDPVDVSSFVNEDICDQVEEQQSEIKIKRVLGDKDECALFGELVAHQLRKFDDRARCIVKHKLNTVLYEAELATYD